MDVKPEKGNVFALVYAWGDEEKMDSMLDFHDIVLEIFPLLILIS